MSQSDPPDELAGSEQPFVAHLVELRDRLIKAVIAIGVAAALLALWPGPSALYDLLAAPLVANLATIGVSCLIPGKGPSGGPSGSVQRRSSANDAP